MGHKRDHGMCLLVNVQGTWLHKAHSFESMIFAVGHAVCWRNQLNYMFPRRRANSVSQGSKEIQTIETSMGIQNTFGPRAV